MKWLVLTLFLLYFIIANTDALESESNAILGTHPTYAAQYTTHRRGGRPGHIRPTSPPPQTAAATTAAPAPAAAPAAAAPAPETAPAKSVAEPATVKTEEGTMTIAPDSKFI